MKKLIVIPLLLMLFAFNGKSSGYADMIEVDESYMESVFADLNQLENYVLEHQGVTLNELKAIGSTLVANVDVSGLGSLGACSMLGGEPPLGIPSFLWGCCLGWVGILLVYILTDNDKEEVKKSLYGCLVGTASSIIVYFIYVGLILSAASAGA